MIILLQILADILHITKILIICKQYLGIEERKNKYIRYAVSILITMTASIGIIFLKNVDADIVIYLISTIFILNLCFNCSFIKTIICGIWTMLIVEGIGMMMILLFDVIKISVNVRNEALMDFCSSSITLILVIVVGVLLKKISKNGLKNINVSYLIFISFIIMADLIVMNVMVSTTIKESVISNKVLFIIGFLFVVLGMYVQIASILLLVVSRNLHKEKEYIIEQCLNEQINHYEYLKEKERKTKKFRHDIKSHLYFLNKLRLEGDTEEFEKYINDIIGSVDELGDKVNVRNDIANALLNKFYEEATNKNIKMRVSGRIPSKCNVSAYDMCTVFFNLLNNAIEAAETAECKEIWVICRYNLNEIIIEIGNYYQNSNGKKIDLKTSKMNKEYHGWGLDNVKDSVEKNNGLMDFEIEENKFIVSITLKNGSE